MPSGENAKLGAENTYHGGTKEDELWSTRNDHDSGCPTSRRICETWERPCWDRGKGRCCRQHRAHPCKERKDGAPSAWMAQGNTFKVWAPAASTINGTFW